MSNGIPITSSMTAERNHNITKTIKLYGKRLFDFIRKKVSNYEDAEDILQDVFYQFAGYEQPIEQLTGWLFSVARNKITDKYRKKQLPLIEDVFVPGEHEEQFEWYEMFDGLDNSPETHYLRNLFWEQLQEALNQLPEEQKAVFVMNEIEGIPFKEISENTGIAVPTLISRKRYAVLHLRQRLETLKNELLNF